MNRQLFLIGLACAALSTVACSSSSRLSNSEIDRACALAARCGSGSSTCVTGLIDARMRADSNGCAAEFAAANRCYLRADSCSVTAACAEAADVLVACSTMPVDTGTTSADAGGMLSGDWMDRLNSELIAMNAPLCFDCPAVFSVEECENPGFTLAEQQCIRAVGNSRGELRDFLECKLPFDRVLAECVHRASLVVCPPEDLTSCFDAHEAGVGTCGSLPQSTIIAYNACLP